ncbi:MAG TPA: DUF1266 domain-containing protein, partial [Polyangiaceae bacterium]|nr:DUF1266 domain-containing protein [Polyangiaceae bacterium]
TDYSRDPKPVQEALARLNEATEPMLAGMEVTDADLEELDRDFEQFYRYLCRKHLTKTPLKFSEPDRAAFYFYATKLAAVQHPNHFAWPLMSPLRGRDSRVFLREADNNHWARLALVTSALLKKDVALAERRVRELPPALAEIAIQWVRETAVGYAPYNHAPSSELLLRALGAEITGPPSPQEDPLPRDQRWALSAGIYPSYGSDSRVALAVPLAPAVCRAALKMWWNVDDSESAVSVLEWLLAEGHGQELRQELGRSDADELSKGQSRKMSIEEKRKRAFLKSNGAALRKYSIKAWDLCRLVDVARSAHKAGFIDEATAWEYILAAARQLRRAYPSWRAIGDDYLLGNRYFEKGGDPNVIQRACVEWLQNSPASPWNRISWDAFEPNYYGPKLS